MSNRRFVIGDVHGHYDALLALLTEIAPNQDDEVYFLGDLIDRGSQSAQVVQFVMDHGYKCILGNHEIMLLDVLGCGDFSREAFYAWLYNGGYPTVKSYGDQIPVEHIEWIRNLPLYIDLGDYWLVHAGLDPSKSIEEQNSENFCWIREPFHSIHSPYFCDKKIIIGHTITFTFPGVEMGSVVSGEGWIGIDTGVYHHLKGRLTALELNELTIHQVNSFGKNYRSIPLAKAVHQLNPKQVLARQCQLM